MVLKPWSRELNIMDEGFLLCDFCIHIGFPFECYTTDVAWRVRGLFREVHELKIREFQKPKLRFFCLEVSISVTMSLRWTVVFQFQVTMRSVGWLDMNVWLTFISIVGSWTTMFVIAPSWMAKSLYCRDGASLTKLG